MSLEQLKAFLEKIKGDTSLQEKLKAAKTSEDVVGIANECGHHFTSETLSKGQLTDEEMEKLAGGGTRGYCGGGGEMYSLCNTAETL